MVKHVDLDTDHSGGREKFLKFFREKIICITHTHTHTIEWIDCNFVKCECFILIHKFYDKICVVKPSHISYINPRKKH